MIAVGLCAGLMPGCALLGLRTTPAAGRDKVARPGPQADGPDAAAPVKTRAGLTSQKSPLAISTPPDTSYHSVLEQPLLPGADDSSPGDRKPSRPAEHADDEAQSADRVPREGPNVPAAPEPDLATQPPTVRYQAAPARPAEKKEPLLEALECFLKDRPDRALGLLKGYRQSSQDVYIALLPILAQLTHKGVDQLTPEEVSAIHEQLHGLAEQLRPRAPLVIDRMCCCERIKGFGQYRALQEDHAFRARSGDRPGDQVTLYVELRNFALQPCRQGYVTRLSSAVEIADAGGKQLWYHSFKDWEDKEGPLYRQAAWNDCFGNYCFYMPHIPPGSYTLTLTIRDLTYPETPRVAHKAVALRVG
jgi:hypothetical protein